MLYGVLGIRAPASCCAARGPSDLQLRGAHKDREGLQRRQVASEDVLRAAQNVAPRLLLQLAVMRNKAGEERDEGGCASDGANS
jgi:hypothetical protein